MSARPFPVAAAAAACRTSRNSSDLSAIPAETVTCNVVGPPWRAGCACNDQPNFFASSATMRTSGPVGSPVSAMQTNVASGAAATRRPGICSTPSAMRNAPVRARVARSASPSRPRYRSTPQAAAAGAADRLDNKVLLISG